MEVIYTAVPLDFGPSTNIRLLEVLPSDKEDDVIACTMHVTTFSNASSYTALSYVWGDSENTKSISVNGTPFRVRHNLWEFLNIVRQDKNGCQGHFWIDAICINQNENDERSHQVSFMGEIYASATKVIVWLGCGNDEAIQAMDVLSIADARGFAVMDTPDGLQSGRGLKQLFRNEYWTRTWIIQEFFLAKEVDIWCGNRVVSARVLFGIYNLWRETAEQSEEGQLCSKVLTRILRQAIRSPAMNVIRWDRVYNHGPSGLSFVVLRRLFIEKRCSDIRDRIFAMLSLLTLEERVKIAIEPDYSMTTSRLFRAVYDSYYGEGPHHHQEIRGLQQLLELPNDDKEVLRVIRPDQRSRTRCILL